MFLRSFYALLECRKHSHIHCADLSDEFFIARCAACGASGGRALWGRPQWRRLGFELSRDGVQRLVCNLADNTQCHRALVVYRFCICKSDFMTEWCSQTHKLGDNQWFWSQTGPMKKSWLRQNPPRVLLHGRSKRTLFWSVFVGIKWQTVDESSWRVPNLCQFGRLMSHVSRSFTLKQCPGCWISEQETEDERQARYAREADEMKLKWDARHGKSQSWKFEFAFRCCRSHIYPYMRYDAICHIYWSFLLVKSWYFKDLKIRSLTPVCWALCCLMYFDVAGDEK